MVRLLVQTNSSKIPATVEVVEVGGVEVQKSPLIQIVADLLDC